MAEAGYAETRGELEEALRTLTTLADERFGPRIAEGTRSLLKKLAEELFNVVVVGEFKRGKTTFVNAFLGADVLPAAVVPLTSIVTAAPNPGMALPSSRTSAWASTISAPTYRRQLDLPMRSPSWPW